MVSRRARKVPEPVPGSYSAIPHVIMDCNAFQGASHAARSLLYELIRQLNGHNNGHLQLASKWLKKRGWTSADVVQRAKNELLERGLIILTRQGGLNLGPNYYGVTWLNISNFVSLDLARRSYCPGHWRQMDNLRPLAKCRPSSVSRSRPVPSRGTVVSLAAPSHGSRTALSGDPADPSNGNNVCTNTPQTAADVAVDFRRREGPRPIVGAAGRSGKRVAV